jgi:uncharacterized protein YndB with AHSA1/START domain
MNFTITTVVNQSIEDIWQAWTDAYHMQKWFFASQDWHCPKAASEFEVGGEFAVLFAEKYGTNKFPFRGTYTKIIPHQFIEYFTEDGRQVSTYFVTEEDGIHITQEIEPELSNPLEVQKDGWKNILNNFKNYVEGL